MKPSLIQRFFASAWLTKAWCAGITISTVTLAMVKSGFSVDLLRDWTMVSYYFMIIALTLPLGWFSAILAGCFILAPIYHTRGLMNGAPFLEGDMVYIISGKCKATTARVYSKWQHDTVRVDIGESAKKTYDDIFSPCQLIKIQEAEPSGAPKAR